SVSNRENYQRVIVLKIRSASPLLCSLSFQNLCSVFFIPAETAMAEASRLFQTTFLPSFHPLHRTHKLSPSSFTTPTTTSSLHRKLKTLHCSSSLDSATRSTTTATVTQEVPWGCDIDSPENAKSLQKWLSDSGLPPQKMGIEKVQVGERGLVALNNIRKGEKLLFVPPSLFITADSCFSNSQSMHVHNRSKLRKLSFHLRGHVNEEWSCPEVGEVLKKYSVPDWPLIATYLISEASLEKSSRWSNYISALPRQPYSLLYWYNDLKLRIFSKHPQLFPEEVFNIESFRWSFGILFSRLVRLPSLDGKVALVPWADMLNHSCEVETFLDYDKSSKGVVFTTDRPYQLGIHILREEI
ncbi:Ribulose-1,5 bisphosphate carboxylase/oxygenase large subunit N-methyltransferase, chloroplastic, partial [Linum grandiflorum]